MAVAFQTARPSRSKNKGWGIVYQFSKTEAATRTAKRGLRAAVVGAGYFGRIHAGKYAAMANVDLVTVVDPDLSRAQAVAEEIGAEKSK